MRELLTFRRVTIVAVVMALAAIALVVYLVKAPKIDCSPPGLEPLTVWGQGETQEDYWGDEALPIHGELLEVTSNEGSHEFVIRDDDRGLLTFTAQMDSSVALDMIVGRTVSVEYERWYYTTGGGTFHFVMHDDQGLVFILEESGGSGEYPPFSVQSIGGLCHGDGPLATTLLEFAAQGHKVRAATGEHGTLEVDGRDYVVLTVQATELIDFDTFDIGGSSSFVIARLPQ